jgi:hypothetical protein
MIPAITNASLARHTPGVGDAAARPVSARAAPLVSPLVIEKLAPEVGAPAGAATTSTSRTATTPGYASATASKKDPYPFLKDPKLGVEEKLMRLLAQLDAEYEKKMEEKMRLIAGGEAASTGGKATSATGGTAKPKTKGFLGSLANAVNTFFPAVGIATSLLKTKSVQTLLGKIGGPVMAAAATAMGFPHLAPALLKLGPSIVNVAVDAAKAFDAAVEEPTRKASSSATSASSASLAEASSDVTASASSSSSGASSSKTVSEGERQIHFMDLQRLRERQKEMFMLVSNILKSGHDTRCAIIANVR